MTQPSFLQRKIVHPFMALLKQGITPERMALSLVMGLILGCFPVLGSTTLLCTVVALTFRLNLPAIQLVNYLVYPLQILLFLPFIRIGERLLSAQPLPFSIAQILEMFRRDFWGSLVTLGSSTGHALLAWLLIAPFVALVLVYPIAWGLRRAGLRAIPPESTPPSTTAP